MNEIVAIVVLRVTTNLVICAVFLLEQYQRRFSITKQFSYLSIKLSHYKGILIILLSCRLLEALNRKGGELFLKDFRKY